MVKGNWILSLKKMKSKNWVNGIEVGFSLDREGTILGEIHHIPREIVERASNAIELAVLVCRMQQQATALFRKMYHKKTSALERN
ncbi:MAG: hypothetical protein LBG73_02240 [Spirochaetaceae bacterium]|jgi:hypothetical protein|nr:hypothetical protein [Spirochaetaceae bacterium]